MAPSLVQHSGETSTLLRVKTTLGICVSLPALSGNADLIPSAVYELREDAGFVQWVEQRVWTSFFGGCG